MSILVADWSNSYRPTRINSEFSCRETEVLWLALQGRMAKEIARSLCISTRTVSNHVHRMGLKLGTHSRMQMVLLVMNRLSDAARE